jgi:hypothetical protein
MSDSAGDNSMKRRGNMTRLFWLGLVFAPVVVIIGLAVGAALVFYTTGDR